MDETRWLDENSAATALERALVRSVAELEPPRGAEEAGWSNLCAKLGLPPGEGGSGDGDSGGPDGVQPGAETAGIEAIGAGSVGAKTLGGAPGAGAAPALLTLKAAVVKAFVAGAALGTIATAGIAALTNTDGSEAAKTPNGPALAASAPRPAVGASRQFASLDSPGAALRSNESAAQPGAARGMSNFEKKRSDDLNRAVPTTLSSVPQLERSASATAVASFPADASPPSRLIEGENPLKQEASLVQRAHAGIRRGDLPAAYAALEEARMRFPQGALAQEREAMMIDLLARSGSKAAARARAKTFLSEHPTSPHAEGVRRLVE